MGHVLKSETVISLFPVASSLKINPNITMRRNSRHHKIANDWNNENTSIEKYHMLSDFLLIQRTYSNGKYTDILLLAGTSY